VYTGGKYAYKGAKKGAKGVYTGGKYAYKGAKKGAKGVYTGGKYAYKGAKKGAKGVYTGGKYAYKGGKYAYDLGKKVNLKCHLLAFKDEQAHAMCAAETLGLPTGPRLPPGLRNQNESVN